MGASRGVYSISHEQSLECKEGGFVLKGGKAYVGVRETGGDNM